MRTALASVAPVALLLSLPADAQGTAFVAPPSTAATAGPEKGLKPGFRDLKWGDPISRGMTKMAGDGVIAIYVRESDKLSVGDVALKILQYGFFRDQLSSVRLTTDSGSALLRILTENWGTPRQPNEFIKYYMWSKGDTRAGFEINEITGEGDLSIASKPLYEEADKVRKAKAAKAKEDL